MEWKLELVPVPVSDVDVAKAFYADRLGFTVDHDTVVSESMRVIQLTPPGSGCSICIGTGMLDTAPGSVQGLQLVVEDVDAARAELLGRGVEVSEVQHFGADGLAPGKGGPWNAFVFFADPDGNTWALQERPAAS